MRMAAMNSNWKVECECWSEKSKEDEEIENDTIVGTVSRTSTFVFVAVRFFIIS